LSGNELELDKAGLKPHDETCTPSYRFTRCYSVIGLRERYVLNHSK